MKHLYFDYCMLIDYAEVVSRCNFTIKCIPCDNARQKIQDYQIELFPDVPYSEGVDGFNNRQIYGLDNISHTSFCFRIKGNAIVGLNTYEEDENEDQSMIFRHPHGLNIAGERIHAYYEKLKKELEVSAPDIERDANALAIWVMHRLHKDFTYEQDTTTVETSAEEAFAQGKGVCQDYAHIFISLMHLWKIPARYVTGLIVGEGASHAWVEILNDHKWYGLDPTNDILVLDEHIKLGVGRDAHDCRINRGIMHGGGLHTQTIQVNVRGIEE